MVGIKYNTEEQETELNVIKDVDAIYTSLPHNHVTPLKYDNGFWSDVEDEFALSWLGQLINHNEYDAGFNNKPCVYVVVNLPPFDSLRLTIRIRLV